MAKKKIDYAATVARKIAMGAPYQIGSQQSHKGRVAKTRGGSKKGGAAVGSSTNIVCDPMTRAEVAALSRNEPEYITKHIASSPQNPFFESALNGEFYLGTLANYCANEDAPEGRCGDKQESKLIESHSAVPGRPTSFTKSSKGGPTIAIRNCTFGDSMDMYSETFVTNSYCYCASVGAYELDRARYFQECEVDETKKPNTYVTYHFPTLKKAIVEYLRQKSNLEDLALVARKVKYREKDVSYLQSGGESWHSEPSMLKMWEDIAFIKSKKYVNEDEYRLLLVDPKEIGNLPKDIDGLLLGPTPAIAASIVTSGTIPN